METPEVPPGSSTSGSPAADGPGGSFLSPGPPPYPPPPYPQPQFVIRRPTNNMAIASLVVALASLFTCTLLGGIAVYLGNRSRAEIRNTGEEGDGLALAGIIVGWIGVGLGVITALFLVGYFVLMGTLIAGTAASG
ncbi:hypothetical protein GCM10027280_39360 [Micromonospora polyrhachis]|uniref:DUF4190 domain-containing protein n=1 Tax=Micromonospora polyrhachis TaxID=1282883 RepID=A0A7W7WQ04_9ACTN|nr:DUF4190 domain-containing protein [Micromonospora polyrhachis]MBB4959791.1 hypothetical protein [Micromonospora polyrhachis]